MCEKLVIIGANEFQNSLILKAKKLGYQTHVFAWEDGAVGKKNADYFYPISITEKEKILDICKKIKPVGVVSVASDLAMITVNYIAKKLNLKCNSEDCIKWTTNKYLMRERLLELNLSTPNFIKLNEKEVCDDKIKYINNIFNLNKGIIVKPTDRSGSRGITKIYNERDLKVALKNAFEYSFEKSAIIEEYIEGYEYSIETITYEGEHTFLAATKKFTTGEPNFIEIGHTQPSGLSKSKIERATEIMFKAIDALDIKNGASHCEFKIDNDDNIKIIEIGARMGGDCIGSHLVELSTGYDYLRMVIEVAVGKPPTIEKFSKEKKATVHFIFNQNDINKLNKLIKSNEKEIHFISNIENCDRKVVDSSTRLGFYIVLN